MTRYTMHAFIGWGLISLFCSSSRFCICFRSEVIYSIVIWFDLHCRCTDWRLAARIWAASPLRQPWHLSSRGRHFPCKISSCINYVHDVVQKAKFVAFSPDFFGSNGILWDTSRISAHLNCHRNDIVIKYLESGGPKIASLLINANTSFVCSLSASLRAEMNF